MSPQEIMAIIRVSFLVPGLSISRLDTTLDKMPWLSGLYGALYRLRRERDRKVERDENIVAAVISFYNK